MCYAGQCSTSVCLEYGMEECSCTAEEELCDFCCKKDGVCTSAKKLTEVSHNNMIIIIIIILTLFLCQ